MAPARPNPIPTVIAIVAAVLAQSLDSKVLGPILPLIRGDFALSPDEGNWIPIIYVICNFALLPLSPWLVDRFGRRRIVLTSLCGFTVSALASASAVSFPMLFLARAFQGACGAGLISTCHAELRETFPDAKLGSGQVPFIGSFVGLPLALGPFIGGMLFDAQQSWRWAFVIEALIAIAALMFCSRLLPERPPAIERKPLDITGAVLLAFSLAPLQYILYQGDRYGWWDDANIVALSVLSAVAFVAFLAWETRGSGSPLIDVRALARRPAAAVGIVLIFPVAMCLTAAVALIVGFVQQILGFTATMAGELVVIRALSIIPFAFLFGAIMDRKRPAPRVLVPIGLLLLAVSSVMQASTTTSDAEFSTAIFALIIGGIAIGPTVVPLFWSVFHAIPRSSSETLRVATVLDMSLELGTVVATAVVATVLEHRFVFHYDVLRSSVTRAHLATIALPPHMNAGSLIAGLVTQQSYVLAFADGALIAGLIAAIAIPLAVFLRPRSDDQLPARSPSVRAGDVMLGASRR